MTRSSLILLVVLTWPVASLEAQQLPPKKDRAAAQQQRRRAYNPRHRTLEMLRRLQTPVEHVDFDDTFGEILEWFKERGVRNLIINWDLVEQSGSITKDTQITLSMEAVTLGELLDPRDLIGKSVVSHVAVVGIVKRLRAHGGPHRIELDHDEAELGQRLQIAV